MEEYLRKKVFKSKRTDDSVFSLLLFTRKFVIDLSCQPQPPPTSSYGNITSPFLHSYAHGRELFSEWLCVILAGVKPIRRLFFAYLLWCRGEESQGEGEELAENMAIEYSDLCFLRSLKCEKLWDLKIYILCNPSRAIKLYFPQPTIENSEVHVLGVLQTKNGIFSDKLLLIFCVGAKHRRCAVLSWLTFVISEKPFANKLRRSMYFGTRYRNVNPTISVTWTSCSLQSTRWSFFH